MTFTDQNIQTPQEYVQIIINEVDNELNMEDILKND